MVQNQSFYRTGQSGLAVLPGNKKGPAREPFDNGGNENLTVRP